MDRNAYQSLKPCKDLLAGLDIHELHERNRRLEEEIKRLQERVEQVSSWACLGELHAGAAHSFGNVMTSIQATLESASLKLGRGQTGAEIEKKVNMALQLAKDGGELVRQLLSFSGNKKSKSCRISLVRAAEAAVAMCRNHPAARQRTITNLISPNAPCVEGHPGPLQEVIFSLVLNSLQATGPGDNVRIEAEECPDGGVELRVIDNGPGMDAEVLSHAFEPFFSTKGSSGLGLSTCSGLVRFMDGTMAVESEVGKGTTVRVRLKSSKGMDEAA
ncbi:MAG: HAMP domain-containing histidine kinase [Armatimonadetes bacterium]|nr:HAMP domain-containing histidine kinase [Armatimonadota bacterium]